MKIIGIYRCTRFWESYCPSARRRVNDVFLKAELVSHVWDKTGEDYGPPVVNDDDGVILSVRYF
jgi:hypothetical protein